MASAFFALVLALDNLLIREELVHRQIGLGGVFCIGLIVTRAVGPPFELAVIKEDLARIEHLLTFSDRRMPVARVQEHFAFARAHKVVLLIWNVHAVTVHFVQAILICKIVEPKNIAGVDRFDGAGMKIRIDLHCLYDP